MDTIYPDKMNPDEKDIVRICTCLKNGGVVLLPSDTAYGFAVDATNERAIRRVYELKGRDYSKPMHVVVPSINSAKLYVEIDNRASILAKTFLPGPLTIVLPKKENVLPDLLTSNLPTLGIRIPNVVISLKAAKSFGKPYTATSANKSGAASSYSVEECLSPFTDEEVSTIDLIVDSGVLPFVLPSTLVDLTKDEVSIIRPGPISEIQIQNALEKTP